jgi:hypothetical protein
MKEGIDFRIQHEFNGTDSSVRHGSGQKIQTDFEFYISQIAGLYEIMVLLL